MVTGALEPWVITPTAESVAFVCIGTGVSGTGETFVEVVASTVVVPSECTCRR